MKTKICMFRIIKNFVNKNKGEHPNLANCITQAETGFFQMLPRTGEWTHKKIVHKETPASTTNADTESSHKIIILPDNSSVVCNYWNGWSWGRSVTLRTTARNGFRINISIEMSHLLIIIQDHANRNANSRRQVRSVKCALLTYLDNLSGKQVDWFIGFIY